MLILCSSDNYNFFFFGQSQVMSFVPIPCLKVVIIFHYGCNGNHQMLRAEVGRIGIGICYDIRFQELAMIYGARGLPFLLLSMDM